MTDTAATSLRTTPLHARHRASGARMVPYAGWEMPVEYSGITDEHMAVRTRAGVFDVSHMGEIEIAGKGALEAVQRISSNDASALKIGQAQYAGLLTPDGTFIDDMLVYRMASSHFMLVVNAANTAKDYAWISEQVKLAGDAAVVDSSSRYALIAIQGPAAREVLQQLTAVDLSDIRYYWFSYGEVANARVTISRTGYTGEDGYEIFVPPNMADRVWQALIQAGRGEVIPCGLGARDTLRLEAAMRLYGNDIDESTTALEAGLGWTIGWKKGDFIGRERLLEQKERGIARTLRRLRNARARYRAPGLHRHERRRRSRQGHERHADAVPQESRRHGVRPRLALSAGNADRHRHPRPRHKGARRASAVLQTFP